MASSCDWQAEAVREVHKKLTSDLRARPTIDELAKEFLMNPTTLKIRFKSMYGDSIGAYMRKYRILEASVLLKETEEPISGIALRVGYENQSKFAAAFRDVMKLSPGEWRKQSHFHFQCGG